MTRPTLIIGLGGTGQWVLTYLKKDLIEANAGKLPENVRLLAFDTASEIGTTGKSLGEENQDENVAEARIGNITLNKNEEFMHLGGDLLKDTQAIADGNLSHIGAWYRAKDWLKLPPGWLGLYFGAGQLRQFARFALCMDLAKPNQSGRAHVWGRLDTAISQLNRKKDGDNRLDIAIVASLAGGTGSGLLIDFALLAQYLARDIQRLSVHVRGYLVLPGAFAPNVSYVQPGAKSSLKSKC